MQPTLSDDARGVLAELGQLSGRFAGKTILLTGAAGFLGCHFIHYFLTLNDSTLAGQPCRLIAWDNFSRGTPLWLEPLLPRPDLDL
jgi:UDP-glucuronate decarboxylase